MKSDHFSNPDTYFYNTIIQFVNKLVTDRVSDKYGLELAFISISRETLNMKSIKLFRIMIHNIHGGIA